MKVSAGSLVLPRRCLDTGQWRNKLTNRLASVPVQVRDHQAPSHTSGVALLIHWNGRSTTQMGNTNYPVLLKHRFTIFAATKACDELGEACTEAVYMIYLKFMKKQSSAWDLEHTGIINAKTSEQQRHLNPYNKVLSWADTWSVPSTWKSSLSPSMLGVPRLCLPFSHSSFRISTSQKACPMS